MKDGADPECEVPLEVGCLKNIGVKTRLTVTES